MTVARNVIFTCLPGGSVKPLPAQAPLFVAIDAGAFKKYGMDVRYVLTGARTIQALVAGSVQFAQGVSSRTVPSAVLGGADAILIANFVDKLLFTMHSAPEINSMQDLKGKVVGVSGIGGSTDFATRLALREAGHVAQPVHLHRTNPAAEAHAFCSQYKPLPFSRHGFF